MNTYLILPTELARLHEARRLQVERYRTTYLAREGVLPEQGDGDLATDASQMALSLGDAKILVPIKLLTDWARTLDTSTPLTLTLCPDGTLILRHATGTLRVFTRSLLHDESGKPYLTNTYSRNTPVEAEIITLSAAPGDSGLLTASIPADIGTAGDLKAMKAETAKARKAVAHEKALAKARKAEKAALEALMKGCERAEAAQAVLDGQTLADAIAFARRVRQARRAWRSDTITPEIRPAWLSPTYGIAAGPGWDKEANAWSDSLPAQTVDALAEHTELAFAYVDAQAARREYKPRKHWPRWANAEKRKRRPDLGVPVYGPAFDKLNEAENKARHSLVSFLSKRFDEWCISQGLPTGLTHEWLPDEARPYSRARLVVRAWERSVKDELTTAYDVAKAARERVEGGED